MNELFEVKFLQTYQENSMLMCSDWKSFEESDQNGYVSTYSFILGPYILLQDITVGSLYVLSLTKVLPPKEASGKETQMLTMISYKNVLDKT